MTATTLLPPSPPGTAVARATPSAAAAVAGLVETATQPFRHAPAGSRARPPHSSTGGPLRVVLGMLDPGNGAKARVCLEYDPRTNTQSLVLEDQFHSFRLGASWLGLRGELTDLVGWGTSHVNYYVAANN